MLRGVGLIKTKLFNIIAHKKACYDTHFAVHILWNFLYSFYGGYIFITLYCTSGTLRGEFYRWKFRTRKLPLISTLVKVSKIIFCLYYCATARRLLISMFRRLEKFIALVRQVIDRKNSIRGSLARDVRIWL